MTHSPILAHPARAFAVIVVLLASMTLGGCGTISGHLKNESLDRTLKNYERGMRWGNYPVVLSMHKIPPDAPIPLPEDYADYTISGYDIVYAAVMTGDNHAVQTIKIQYVDLPTQRLHAVMDRQAWEYDLEGKRWVLTSPFALPARPKIEY